MSGGQPPLIFFEKGSSQIIVCFLSSGSLIRERPSGIFQPGGDHGFKNDINSETDRYQVSDCFGILYQMTLKNFLVSDNNT